MIPVAKNKVQKLKFNNDFCDKLIAELGNFVGAFEIDEKFSKKKVNRFYCNVAT